MAERKALWIQGSGGTPSFDAIDDRSFLGAVLGGAFFDAVAPGSGMRGRGHGILSSDALAVSAPGTADKATRIGPGMAAVRGSATGQLGCYLVANDANDTVVLDDRPTATNSRRDLIIARVRDATYGITGNDWVLDKLTGTPGTSPTDPTVPAGSAILVLARVTIPPGANPYTVSSGWITDLRPHARAVGGILPIATVAEHPAPQDFDFVWETSTAVFKMRLNGAWVEIGRDLDANWTSVTPNWAGTFTLGNGDQYLRYVRYGTTVTGVAGFTRGSTSSMSGNLVLDLVASGLPAVQSPGAVTGASHISGGRMFDASTVRFWSCTASVDPATNRIQNFGTAGTPVWSPTSPVTWATGDQLRIFFNYEADL